MSNPELLTDWKFLKDWKLLFQLNDVEKNSEVMILPTWNSCNSFFNTFKNFSEKEKKYYLELLERSDEILHEYGGDPLNHTWSDFRPLRLSREEDWSDWLAFFVSESNGSFVFNLFNFTFKSQKVHRELVALSFRADIVVEWDDNNSATIIEVKTGDQNLLKTYPTNKAVESKMSHIKKWDNYILLLDRQIDDITENDNFKIIIWSDVVVALRKCLYEKSENLLWRSLAYTFAGCIEIKLNNSITTERIKVHQIILNIQNQLNIIERSLSNG